MSQLTLPANLAAAVKREGRRRWVATLPATISELSLRWEVQVEEPFQPGRTTAWVAPVLTAHGQRLVMKLVWPHPEAVHEAEALRLWAGRSAVLLHAAEDLGHTLALLLERCSPGVTLVRAAGNRSGSGRGPLAASAVGRSTSGPSVPSSAGLVQPMGGRVRNQDSGSDLSCRSWIGPRSDGAVSPPARDRRAESAAIDRPSCRERPRGRTPAVAGHHPKPYVGDPTFDVLQHMLNCADRLKSDPVTLSNRLARLTGLDPERTRLWLFARCVQAAPAWPGMGEVARLIAPP
jgi:streptomycin 6-kinase